MICVINYIYSFISGLLMPPLLGHRPSLWTKHKENGSEHTTRAQCVLIGANDYKCSLDQRLNVPSEARSRDNKLVTHPMTDQRCITFASARRTDHGAQLYSLLRYNTTGLAPLWHNGITLENSKLKTISRDGSLTYPHLVDGFALLNA
jgi:hypothetical protein